MSITVFQLEVGANTTYSIPSGYYSGGTLDSRTSYMNGYNSGYDKGKKEGGSSVVNGVEYKHATVKLPCASDNPLYDESDRGIYLTNYPGLDGQVIEIYRLPLPKSNPSEIVICRYNACRNIYWYHRSTQSSGSSTIYGIENDDKLEDCEKFIFTSYSYRSDLSWAYDSSEFKYFNMRLNPKGDNWVKLDSFFNYHKDNNTPSYHVTELQYRIENGNQLVFRTQHYLSNNTVAYRDYNSHGNLFCSSPETKSYGPYGKPITIPALDIYVELYCC